MPEILKVKLTDAHMLIAYDETKVGADHRGRSEPQRRVWFKVGPMDDGGFAECSDEAASVLLAMAARSGS